MIDITDIQVEHGCLVFDGDLKANQVLVVPIERVTGCIVYVVPNRLPQITVTFKNEREEKQMLHAIEMSVYDASTFSAILNTAASQVYPCSAGFKVVAEYIRDAHKKGLIWLMEFYKIKLGVDSITWYVAWDYAMAHYQVKPLEEWK